MNRRPSPRKPGRETRKPSPGRKPSTGRKPSPRQKPSTGVLIMALACAGDLAAQSPSPDPSPAEPQSFCDAQLRPAADPTVAELAYAPRENRCEGMYVAEVAGSLDLIGAIRGRFTYALDSGEVVRVEAPDVPHSLSIRAQAFPIRTYYRMDAQLPAGGQLVWPVGAVLKPRNLSSDQVSVAGWLDGGGRPVYVPVVVTPGIAQAQHDQVVRLYYRSTVDLTRVRYRVIKEGEGGVWVERPPAIAGRPIVLSIPAGVNGRIGVALQGETRAGNVVDRLVLVNLGPYDDP